MAYRIGFDLLGCDKNRINLEQMMYRLQQAGYELSDTPEGADLVIVNTCAFIDSAKAEAIEHILTLGEWKKAGKIGKLLVTGCLAERFRAEVLDEMPEVDGVLGCGSYQDVVQAVSDVLQGARVQKFGPLMEQEQDSPRILTTPGYYAYLKIAEGCDNHCCYCVIPKLRGKYRSRTMENILGEAKWLASRGVKELIQVAQDTGRYGLDLYGERRFAQLLRELCRLDFHWIRIHYLYPDEITDELIEVVRSEPKIVKYLDIPIQHVNDLVLKRMNRRGNQAFLDQMLCSLREKIPGLVLRTSVITGLPYEDEAAFEELCAFLLRHKMERAGAFVFSPEEGTPAAKMEYPPNEIAQCRAEQIVDLQSEVIDAYNESRLGTVMEVLCEGFDEAAQMFVGRTYADSPEVDGRVYFESAQPVPPGTFVDVFLRTVMDGDLVGTADF